MKKLNILYVDFSVGFGGSAVSLKNLTRGINAMGHNIVVAFIFQKKKSLDRKNLFPGNTKVIYLGDLVTDAFLKISRYLYDNDALVKTKISFFLMFFIKIFAERIPTVVKLFFLIKTEGIDVVHVNNGISIPIILSANLAKTPCIISLRSFVNETLASRRILRNVRCFVANSQAVKNDFIQKSNLQKDVVRVIYNRIDPDKVALAVSQRTDTDELRQSVRPGQKIIGTAGRFLEWKRQDLLILTMEALLRRGIDVMCFIIGTSEKTIESKNYETLLKDMVRAKNLEKNIVFTGFLENPLNLMKELDVFVLPSIVEPFGNVVLESMTLGVPVVAFNEGGPAEIINNGQDGILVPTGDVAALTEAVFRLLSDQDLHTTLSRNAVQKVKTDFSLDQSIRQWDDLYRDLTQDREPGPVLNKPREGRDS